MSHVSLTVMFLYYQYVIGTTSQDCEGPDNAVSLIEVGLVINLSEGSGRVDPPTIDTLVFWNGQPLWGTPIKTRPRQSFSHFCECVNCLKYTFPYHCKSSLKVWKLFFISLYHCIFGQSFYTVRVQWAVHPTFCDIVYKQTATWLE